VAVGAGDAVIAGEFGVFVVAQDVGEEVFDEGDGVGFGDVAGVLPGALADATGSVLAREEAIEG